MSLKTKRCHVSDIKTSQKKMITGLGYIITLDPRDQDQKEFKIHN